MLKRIPVPILLLATSLFVVGFVLLAACCVWRGAADRDDVPVWTPDPPVKGCPGKCVLTTPEKRPKCPAPEDIITVRCRGKYGVCGCGADCKCPDCECRFVLAWVFVRRADGSLEDVTPLCECRRPKARIPAPLMNGVTPPAARPAPALRDPLANGVLPPP